MNKLILIVIIAVSTLLTIGCTSNTKNMIEYSVASTSYEQAITSTSNEEPYEDSDYLVDDGNSLIPDHDTSAASINRYVNNWLVHHNLPQTIYKDTKDYKGWYLDICNDYIDSENLDDLKQAAQVFKSFLPTFLFKYVEYFIPSSDTNLAQYTIVMVNSNILDAVTICVYINEDTKMYIEMLIYSYNANGGLFI